MKKTISVSILLTLLVTGFLFKGCRKDQTIPEPNENIVFTNGEGTISSAGGKILVGDQSSSIYGAFIEIPEGALLSGTHIKIMEAPSGIDNPADSLAIMVRFEPKGLIFEKPVTIGIPVIIGADTTGLNIFHFNPDSVAYTQIPKKRIDINNKIIIGETMHFSYYTAFDNSAKIDIEMLNINGKIGVRLKLKDLNKIYTSISFCYNTGLCNVWAVIKDGGVYNKSVFNVSLFRYRSLWLDDWVGVKNIYVWRQTSGSFADAVVLQGYDPMTDEELFSTPYLSWNNPTSQLAIWKSGEPLIFYFDDFQPNPDHKYFVKIKWFYSMMAVQNFIARATPLYEFENKEVRMQLAEMTTFPLNQLHESGAIDNSYTGGGSLSPTVTTTSVTNIGQTTAQSGGNVTSQGSSNVTGRGVAWISSENLFNQITYDFIKSQELSSNNIDGSNNENNQLITGSIVLYKTSEGRFGKFRVVSYGYNIVLQWVTYNSNGTIYSSGNNLTIRGTFHAELDNGNESNINADFHWNIHTDQLRYLMPQNGALFKVLDNFENAPTLTLNDGVTNNGTGEGSFTSNITGLNANSAYFLRAYASSSVGTGYGLTVRFLTQQNSNQIPVAAFTGSPASGTAPLTVSFTDQSTNNPTSWFWEFGDGTTSTQRNPSKTYNSVGNYSVDLTATNANGSDTEIKTNYIQVSAAGNAPVAAFTATPTIGNAPLQVQFTDQSTNNPTNWNWNFGDGNTSNLQNPEHTYNNPGNYTVSLTVANAYGSDTETKNNFVNVSEGGNGDNTQVVEVLNPATGKTWMDRNLGASRAAISSTDSEAYGDLYQWGRAADGHQIRTSPTTSTLSNSDNPGHGNFILAPNTPYDWRSPQNNNLWQGVNGINNPCPAGYRLPTIAELDAERLSWSTNNAAGAFNSPLKLPVGGRRYYASGSLSYVGSLGYYWSSTVVGLYARRLRFDSSSAGTGSDYNRAYGYSVRCLKD